MFNLEEKITEWRKQMLAAGIQTPEPLEELEIHLREKIERQTKLGLGARRAFEIAVKEIGPSFELHREFKKIGTPMKTAKIIKLAGLICVVVTLFCPLFMMLPVLLANDLGLMTKLLGLAVYVITVTTIVLTWKYNHMFLPVIAYQPMRRTIGMVCYAGCLLWIRFGMFHYPPGGPDPRSLLLPLAVFGAEWIVMAILGGVGHGLEKAAAEKSEPANLLAS